MHETFSWFRRQLQTSHTVKTKKINMFTKIPCNKVLVLEYIALLSPWSCTKPTAVLRIMLILVFPKRIMYVTDDLQTRHLDGLSAIILIITLSCQLFLLEQSDFQYNYFVIGIPTCYIFVFITNN